MTDPVRADDVSPIARLTVSAGNRVTEAFLYTPGLPEGQHDVWCVPVTPDDEASRAVREAEQRVIEDVLHWHTAETISGDDLRQRHANAEALLAARRAQTDSITKET